MTIQHYVVCRRNLGEQYFSCMCIPYSFKNLVEVTFSLVNEQSNDIVQFDAFQTFASFSQCFSPLSYLPILSVNFQELSIYIHTIQI